MPQRLTWLVLLSAMVIAVAALSGCGGGITSGSPSASTSGPTTNPPSPGVSVVSNWQLSTTSTVGGMPLTIAGSISLSGSSVSGAVHISGSNCFDRLTTVALSGTLTGGSISLTSASVAGQVASFTGTFSDPGTFQPGNFTGA